MELPFNIVSRSSKESQLYYLVIVVILSFLFSTTIKLDISAVFGIIVSIYIIYEISNYEKNNDGDMNIKLEKKLIYLDKVLSQSLKTQKTTIGLRKDSYIENTEPSTDIKSFLYLDPNLINLLYSVRDYELYSEIVFGRVLRSVNFMLKLKNDMLMKTPSGDIALQDVARNFQAASSFGKQAMNYFNSFIHSLPSNTYYQKKQADSMKRLQLLIKRNTDEMKIIYEKQNKNKTVTPKSVFIGNEYDGPKFLETMDDLKFHHYL